VKRDSQTTWLGFGAATVCAGAFLISGPAGAQAPVDDWQFRATIYGYFPDIGASAAFPAGPSTTIDVNANKLISHLKLAFMGSIEAQKGRWGAFTDVMYFNVGGSRSGVRDLAISGMPLPPRITADASLDIDAWVWTLAGNYRAVSAPEMNVDVFAGARMLDVDSRLGWNFSADFGPFVGPGRQGSADAKLTNWDGVVGAKGRLNFGESREWFVPYYVDVGTGDSDLTWQGIAGIGYAFKWGEVIAAWRYLKYDFKSNQKLENLTFNGPAVGVAFHW
jgi:hypothetical protein